MSLKLCLPFLILLILAIIGFLSLKYGIYPKKIKKLEEEINEFKIEY